MCVPGVHVACVGGGEGGGGVWPLITCMNNPTLLTTHYIHWPCWTCPRLDQPYRVYKQLTNQLPCDEADRLAHHGSIN